VSTSALACAALHGAVGERLERLVVLAVVPVGGSRNANVYRSSIVGRHVLRDLWRARVQGVVVRVVDVATASRPGP
jgi:hypothetical protein